MLSYRQAFLESTKISVSEELNALEVAPAQFMVLQILGGKGEVRIAVSEIKREMPFSPSVLHA